MAQKVGRGIALLFHDRGTRRGWVVSSTPRPHFTPGKDPVPILQEAGSAPGPVWTGGESRPHPTRPTIRTHSLLECIIPFVRNVPDMGEWTSFTFSWMSSVQKPVQRVKTRHYCQLAYTPNTCPRTRSTWNCYSINKPGNTTIIGNHSVAPMNTMFPGPIIRLTLIFI